MEDDLVPIAKQPEPLFTKPASSDVDDVRYSVASHLYVDELVELKSVSVDWKNVARSVLCSMPLSWEPPPAAAVQLWEEVQDVRSHLNLASLRRMISAMNFFEAASLLTRVAESFFSHLEEWANISGWIPSYIQVFLSLLERSHPDAIAPHMQNITRLCELPCIARFAQNNNHVFLRETPVRIFDAEAAFFVARRHWFITRCSSAAMRPHFDTLVDVYPTSSDAFRLSILPTRPTTSSFLLSIIAHPSTRSLPLEIPTWGRPPSKEEVAIYDHFNLGASALTDNAVVVMRVLTKLPPAWPVSRHRTDERIVDTFEQGDITEFAPSLTFKNHDFYPHVLMRVDDDTSHLGRKIFFALHVWAPRPRPAHRLPKTIWSTLSQIIGEGLRSFCGPSLHASTTTPSRSTSGNFSPKHALLTDLADNPRCLLLQLPVLVHQETTRRLDHRFV